EFATLLCGPEDGQMSSSSNNPEDFLNFSQEEMIEPLNQSLSNNSKKIRPTKNRKTARRYEELGKKIKEAREEYGDGTLAQNKLADLLKMHETTISRYESGRFRPTPEKLEQIAKILGKPIEFFELEK
ncbi:MAG: helix-turn-helix transcriptional regulator, partial [Chlamydiota bacterium]